MLQQIQYNNSVVAYHVFGKGKQYLFCLHGYGESGESFAIFEESLGSKFTLIAIDLPLHGHTVWNEGMLFTHEQLLQIFEQIIGTTIGLQQLNILGFSMGGRVSFIVIEKYPQLIGEVVLAAPDGLHSNFWHQFSTQTMVGNWLFKQTMYRPGIIIGGVKIAYKLGLYNKRLYDFVMYYLGDKQARLQLYQRWVTMRKFTNSQAVLQQQIQQHSLQLQLVFGKYDAVIKTQTGRNFAAPINQHVTITELDAGHQLLKPKYVQNIVQLFRA